MVNFISKKEIDKLQKATGKNCKTKNDHYEQLMMDIQQCLVKINDCKEKRDPKLIDEIVDLSLLSHVLAVHQDASKDLFDKRFKDLLNAY